jgi:hypothetical protein
MHWFSVVASYHMVTYVQVLDNFINNWMKTLKLHFCQNIPTCGIVEDLVITKSTVKTYCKSMIFIYNHFKVTNSI